MDTKALSEHKRLRNMAIVTIPFKEEGVGRKRNSKCDNVSVPFRFPQQKAQKLECVMQTGRKADRTSDHGLHH